MPPANQLLAGSAHADISPRAGPHLSGSTAEFRPAQRLADPLFAKALVLESGGRKLCILTLDVTIVCAPYTAIIRQAAAEQFGFDPDAVMVHATQTHSAPSLGHFMVDDDFPPLPPEFEWVRGSNDECAAFAAEQAIDAIGRANDALRPVQVGVGSGIEGRAAFNRRAVMRNGQVGMPGRGWQEPLGPTWIRYIEGPIDPEVGVLCLRADDLSLPAMLLSYTCHPVHGFPSHTVTADWPGALASEVRRAHGHGCLPLVINGTCGNINPWPPFEPNYTNDQQLMARMLGDMANKIIETLVFTPEATLDWRVVHLPIPLRDLTPEELQWAKGVIEAAPVPVWIDPEHRHIDPEWTVAASIYSVDLFRQRTETLDYEIQVIRIGDAAFVGLPGEPFVELGLAVKLASPAQHTYIAHCTSHYVGYIPTRDALQRGGHEVNTRYWAKLVPDAGEMIVAAATDTLRQVFT